MTTLNAGYVVICNHEGCTHGKKGRPAVLCASDDPSEGFTTADEARKVAAKHGWAHWWSPGNGRGKIGRKKLDFCPICKLKEADPAAAGTLDDREENDAIVEAPVVEAPGVDATIEAPC